MTKYETLLTILAMLSLGSCSESLNSKVSSTAADATPSFATSATPLPVATMVSLIPPSPTPTTATTPTVLPEARFQYQCLEIVPSFPPATTITGTLVFEGYQDHPTYLWNLETGAKVVLSETDIVAGDLVGEIQVSPNGKLLAYSLMKKKQLSIQIVNVEGQVLQSLPWDEAWATLVGWLDNTRLMIDREGAPLYSLMILNPFTGQKQELFSDYPGIFSIWHEVGWDDFSAIAAVYDPTLTQVVYPHGPEYVLWDMPTRQVVARIPSHTALNNAPRWSPDGKQFLVVDLQQEWKKDQPTQEELIAVSYDGKTTPLTHLSARFAGIYTRHAVWSPDGRYVAFWLGINVPPGEAYRDYMELAVLDTSMQKVTDYCLKGNFSKGEWAPVWSPNSTQLLVQAPPKAGKVFNNVLVDIAQGFAVQIEENAVRMTWMRSNS